MCARASARRIKKAKESRHWAPSRACTHAHTGCPAMTHEQNLILRAKMWDKIFPFKNDHIS